MNIIKDASGQQADVTLVWETHLSPRFEGEQYPNVSDICGSDWAAHEPLNLTPKEYQQAAVRAAARIYPDYNGMLAFIVSEIEERFEAINVDGEIDRLHDEYGLNGTEYDLIDLAGTNADKAAGIPRLTDIPENKKRIWLDAYAATLGSELGA